MKITKSIGFFLALVLALGALPVSAIEQSEHVGESELPIILVTDKSTPDDDKSVKFTVTFEADGGYIFPKAVKTGDDGKLTSLPTPSKYGFKFDGWFTAKEGGEKITVDTVFTENTTVYAHWSHGVSSIKNFTLTFETGSGSAVNALTQPQGTMIDLNRFVSTREGYTFTGWYSDRQLTVKLKTVQLSSDMKVYAGWSATEETVAATKSPFTDVAVTDTYFESVVYASDNKLMNGIGGGLFAPDLPVTRGMLITILWRIEGSPEILFEAEYNDVIPEQYYFIALNWGLKNGIISGYGGGLYKLDDPLTREQSAALLSRYATYKQIDTISGINRELGVYADGASVSDWAQSSYKWALAEGLFGADAENKLSPQSPVKRCELAVLLHTLCEDVLK